MNKKILTPIIVLILASMSCSLFTPNQPVSEVVATSAPVQVVTQAPLPSPTDVVANTPAATQENGCPAVSSSTCTTIGSSDQPVELKGTFTYSNDILTVYYVENAVALVDMYGFVTRNKDWKIPVSSQTLGFMKIDTKTKQGTFDLQLPERPTAMQVDVDPQNKNEAGVQVFALAYWPNLAGGPYSEGDDPSQGWPSYLTSMVTDSENQDEVIGGKLVVWSPDAQENFPSGFGTDGKLFTADDPVMPVPAGWSVIDLDKKPFSIIQTPQPDITLYEPKDVAIKDYSNLSYSDAFKNVVDFLKTQYAFNGIEGKQPNWDALYQKYAPIMADADKTRNALEFAQAMHDFTLAFKDGHTGVWGNDISRLYAQNAIGGYGFALRELADKRVIVVIVVPNSPAEIAGMKVGAEVTQWNGKPIEEAINQVQPFTGPFSSSFDLRYNQVRFLTRAPLNTQASVTFKNPGGSDQTVQMTTINEQDSFYYTDPLTGLDRNGLPVTYKILPQNVGYIKISSNYDDLNLVIRLFERALKTFQDNQITSIIIDMRQNLGGANLGLAGFLYDKEIVMGQLEYYSDKTGKFEPEGEPDKVIPNQSIYHFNKIIVLVGLGCASACELEAYGFSKIPGAIVMGEYPTSGTEAEVARGQFTLPDGLSMQSPTGRMVLPDGSLFLEGKGVQLTNPVAITQDVVLSKGDPVLDQAVQAATK